MIVRTPRTEAAPTAAKAVIAIAAIVHAIALLVVAATVHLSLRRTAAGDEGRKAGVALFVLVAPRLLIALKIWLRLVLRLRLLMILLLRPLHLLVRLLLSALKIRLLLRLVAAARIVTLVVELIAAVHVGTLERLLLMVRVLLRELRLRRHDHSIVVLGVLQISFSGDGIAGGLRVASELRVFLGNVVGGSTDLHIGTVRFVHARHRIVTATIAAAHALIVVLPVSHCIPSLSLRGSAASLRCKHKFTLRGISAAPFKPAHAPRLCA
jgi:hypothetical protein